MLYPFGNEIRFLNTTITTATHTKFNLKNKRFIKFILRLTGLPHFGARLRAYYLNKLLHQINPGSYVLDAGCGIGLNTFLAARKGFTVFGIDNDPQKISIANNMLKKSQFNNIQFTIGDITKIKPPSNLYDCVICFEVLEHIEDDEKALKSISRVIKENGSLLLSVPGIGFISRANQHHKHHVREGYSLEELREKLTNNNLKITKIIGIEHTPIGFLLRFLNDEMHQKSLMLTTFLFPFFFPLAIVDGLLPEILTPNNWIIVAKKQ